MYKNPNKPQAEQTASPSRYPQGYFKAKPCKACGCEFSPQAPSHLHCSDACKDRSFTDRYLQRTYGIGVAEYEAMLEQQAHRCAICAGEGFVMDENRHSVRLVVDHDHETGQVRGLLCHNCNRALGLLQDSTDTLRAAIGYLEGATTIPQGSTLKRAEAHGP